MRAPAQITCVNLFPQLVDPATLINNNLCPTRLVPALSSSSSPYVENDSSPGVEKLIGDPLPPGKYQCSHTYCCSRRTSLNRAVARCQAQCLALTQPIGPTHPHDRCAHCGKGRGSVKRRKPHATFYDTGEKEAKGRVRISPDVRKRRPSHGSSTRRAASPSSPWPPASSPSSLSPLNPSSSSLVFAWVVVPHGSA